MFDEETLKVLLAEFLAENRESLDQIERGILALEMDPENMELLNTVFRHMHTVKGNCRMMEFSRLEELTHAAENLLDLLRERKITAHQGNCGVLLGILDTVRHTLDGIERSGSEGNPDFSRPIQALERLTRGGDSGSTSLLVPDCGPGDSSEPADSALPCRDAEPERERSGGSGLQTVRLPIEKLDALMNMVGELGSAFNQLRYALHHGTTAGDTVLEGMETRIHQLQDEVLKYRLQPIDTIWEPLHRLVRDLAMETGKKAILDIQGGETEMDRNVLLTLKECMGHLLRNAIDHGIEPPHEREVAGKSILGHVRLHAEQRHGQIFIEVSDDGRGLDVEKIRTKAIELGLLDAEQARHHAEEEVFRVIFEPGFSTVGQVSKISGRGTGMDVVKNAMTRLNGTIAISSQLGRGTQFRFRIPQTMAIVPSLLLGSGDGQYAVPQANIVELISYFGADVQRHVEKRLHGFMVRIRDRLFPLLPLDQILHAPLHGNHSPQTPALQTRSACHVVLLRAEGGEFALAVEKIADPIALVVKPMLRLFSHLTILSGTALLPDGSVAFLLNVGELCQLQSHVPPPVTSRG
ncbi:MAG: chemotaxis protein CheA [Magnetococcales bacterium]|nr:chemotaxis protein CheA [Magnetococcales bacterium]MBF0321641.1 chemotaxis protein CheA [Magnetococcales bacterium]